MSSRIPIAQTNAHASNEKRRTSCHFSQNKRRTRAPDERSDEVSGPAWLSETVPTEAPVPSGLDIQSSFSNPEQSHEQPAWLNSISEIAKTPGTARPYSNRIYMDEMLESESVLGKEFHASLIPKVIPQTVRLS